MVNALDHIILSEKSEVDDNIITMTILSRQFWVLGALVSVLPFSFYRTLDELKRASALALVFVFMLVCMIIMYAHGIADPCANSPEEICRGEIVQFTDFPSTMSKIPIFVFAFTCQQNIFPIVNEIEQLSQRRVGIVIIIAIGSALVLFCVVAVEGYRTFGAFVRGDILLNYPENIQVTFLRICIAIMLALHYPLQLDPSRRCMTSLVKVVVEWWQNHAGCYDGRKPTTSIFNRKQSSGVQTELCTSSSLAATQKDCSYIDMNQTDNESMSSSDNMFNIITISFLLLSFIVAMIVDDLGTVLALVGATGSTLVSYILPGLIYLKLNPDSSRSMALIQLIAGICIIPLSLYCILTKQSAHR